MKCPKEYPYENIAGDICLDKNGDKYYYQIYESQGTNANDDYYKYKLVSDCKSINRYHLNKSYECIDISKCWINSDPPRYLYYDNSVCYLSCLNSPNITNKFSFDSSVLGAPQKMSSKLSPGILLFRKRIYMFRYLW